VWLRCPNLRHRVGSGEKPPGVHWRRRWWVLSWWQS